VTIEDWQAVGIVCGALLALLTLAGLVYRKGIRPMWRSMKLAARLLEQLVGDPEEGIPSLMDQLATLQRSDAEMARKLDDHLEWHANPGGRPAKAVPPRPNGPSSGRRT
jgi:hypothetical protein